jgi:nucleoside-diphosphate-sugar epimerase
MAILITGGTGFLGSHVARRLVVDRGRKDVVLYDRYPAEERIEDIRDRVTIVEGDVLDRQALLDTMERHAVDRVAHLAFMPGTAHPERIVPYVELTCVGTATVFDAARLHGVERVVNASSMAVYGDARGDLGEDDPARPSVLYGSCKLWTEQLADVVRREHGLDVLSLRVCATMGIGRLRRASNAAGLMNEERAHFMAFPELAALGNPVTMPPDEQLTEFLYADDAAEAWCLALTAPTPEHAVFNLSAGRCRVGEITAAMRAALPEADIAVADIPTTQGPLLQRDRIADELGFRPAYDVESAVTDYVSRARSAA